MVVAAEDWLPVRARRHGPTDGAASSTKRSRRFELVRSISFAQSRARSCPYLSCCTRVPATSKSRRHARHDALPRLRVDSAVHPTTASSALCELLCCPRARDVRFADAPARRLALFPARRRRTMAKQSRPKRYQPSESTVHWRSPAPRRIGLTSSQSDSASVYDTGVSLTTSIHGFSFFIFICGMILPPIAVLVRCARIVNRPPTLILAVGVGSDLSATAH